MPVRERQTAATERDCHAFRPSVAGAEDGERVSERRDSSLRARLPNISTDDVQS